ncbi:hypothetical protein [Plantactinospora sp. B5E13]|uniref:hypothetical protein n=1 Tax=unclassified Plantactinospora TaxID=2631981 RepID=UPI00325F1881
MSCPKCGEVAEPGATYCLRPECGARLPLTDIAEQEERTETAGAPGSDAADPSKKQGTTPDQAPTGPGDTAAKPGSLGAKPGDTATGPGKVGPKPGAVAAEPASAAAKPGSGGTPPGNGPTGRQSAGTGPDDDAMGPKEGPARPIGRIAAVAAAVLGLMLVGTVVVLGRDDNPARQQATVPPPPAPVGQPMPSSLPSVEPAPTSPPTKPGGSGRPRDGGGHDDNREPAGDREPADDTRRPSADDNQPEPTPRRTTNPPRAPRTQAPPAQPPSITASATAVCYGDGTWAVRITGQVKNGSASIVWGFAQGDDYAYVGSGIGSGTSFSGEVYPAVGDSELTRSSTSWYVQATVNGKQIHYPTGTVSRSC